MGFKRSRVQIPPARCRNGMFYLYVLRSTKTGRRYVGSCEHVEKRLARIIGVNPKQPGMGRLGFWFTLRALIVVPKRSEGRSITKPDAVATNSTADSRSAIAAAIGRGFKSRRPDVI